MTGIRHINQATKLPAKHDSQAKIYLAREDSTFAERLESEGFLVEEFDQLPNEWFLLYKDNRLQLCREGERPFTIHAAEVMRKIDGASKSSLARACGTRPKLRVLDALGGWGTDGFALAALGCQVDIVERSPIIFAMAYFLGRELHSEAIVCCDEALAWITERAKQYDVIYLDPMFPPHPKNAKPSRRMQILEELSPYEDPREMIDIARTVAKERVVVKSRRHQKPFQQDPDWQIKGRTVRFDVYRT